MSRIIWIEEVVPMDKAEIKATLDMAKAKLKLAEDVQRVVTMHDRGLISDEEALSHLVVDVIIPFLK